MTKDEFVRTCVNGGYCSKKAAEDYAKRKKKLDTNDVESIYRTTERILDVTRAQNEIFVDLVGGGKTTKRYPDEE